MSYEKRITGMAPQISMAYIRRRALECAEEEKREKEKLLEEEKEKLLLYLEISEM